MVVAVLVHVVSSVATLQHKNQQNGRDLRQECIAKGGVEFQDSYLPPAAIWPTEVSSVRGVLADIGGSASSALDRPVDSIRIYNILKNLDGDDDDVITQEEFRT